MLASLQKGYNGDDFFYVLRFPTSRERLRENMSEMKVRGHLQECFEERNGDDVAKAHSI